MPRPPVTVVVPFRGDWIAAGQLLAALRQLELREGDELRIADNSDSGVVAGIAPPEIRVVRARLERSSYHARNAGAREAPGEWLLFLDADCLPDPSLLDDYFAEAPAPRCGVVGGEIRGDESQSGLMPRYARARHFLSQTEGLHGKAGSAAASANMLVRLAAFDEVGGFAEGIRSGGDVDLCWRLQERGWTLEYRPQAAVVHRHRETLRGFLAQVARYAAGARWLDERHPGSSSRWPLASGLMGSAGDIVENLRRGSVDEAIYRALDAVGLLAHNVGYRAPNRAARI